jgi:hypothetical protein
MSGEKRGRGVRMIPTVRLRQIWDTVRTEFAPPIAVVPSSGRGVIRRETRLTPERLQTVLAGRDVEVTLERTILSILQDGETSWWGNQFNVAGGVGGGTTYNRTAVDLVHVGLDQDSATVLDFIELKEWESPDDLHEVAEQVYTYFCMFWTLAQAGVEPNCQSMEVDRVRLWVLAPMRFFQPMVLPRLTETLSTTLLNRIRARQGLPLLPPAPPALKDSPRRMYAQLHENLESLKQERPELAKVSFQPNEIILDSIVGRHDFMASFDHGRIQALLSQSATADSPLDVLDQAHRPQLERWVKHAFTQAGILLTA